MDFLTESGFSPEVDFFIGSKFSPEVDFFTGSEFLTPELAFYWKWNNLTGYLTGCVNIGRIFILDSWKYNIIVIEKSHQILISIALCSNRIQSHLHHIDACHTCHLFAKKMSPESNVSHATCFMARFLSPMINNPFR